MLTLSFLLCTSAVNGCQNYPKSILPSWFCKGELIDQVTFMLGQVSSFERYSFIVSHQIPHQLRFLRSERAVTLTTVSRWARNIMCLYSTNTLSISSHNQEKLQQLELRYRTGITTLRITETKVVHRHSANRLFKHYDHPSAHWQTSLLLIVVNKENFPT